MFGAVLHLAPHVLSQMQVTMQPRGTTRVEVLSSSDALPAHMGSGFRDAAAFAETKSGQYLVFDRRAQAVYSIGRERSEATPIVLVGPERGRIIRPTAFAAEPGGTFVVADFPEERARLQRFADRGYLLNGFTLPASPIPALSFDGYALGGIVSLQFTGESIFLSQPQTGSLVTEYSWNGQVRRAFGSLRKTGHEADSALHLALNAIVPLVDPTGGFFVVFRSGTPVFRKYDPAGRLVFERHIEGRELDETLTNQPETWPKRLLSNGQEWPAVPAVVRTATVDPRGNLWVAFNVPFVYVYSPDGEKIRTLQLRAAGLLTPTSLFFAGASRLLVTPGCYIFDTGK